MITIIPKSKDEKPIEPLAVDTKTAARLLGVCERTVASLAKRGLIKRKKTGWRSQYLVSSIKHYLETPDNESKD